MQFGLEINKDISYRMGWLKDTGKALIYSNEMSFLQCLQGNLE